MKSLKLIVFIIFTSFLLLISFEGLCSMYLVFRGVAGHVDRDMEGYYTKYDELLGWISKSNFTKKNLFGKGRDLKTNSQSFRNDKDFSTSVPEGKIRIICSGDSFTFGYGVDNKHTWCEKLASFDKQFETVNLGQSGYGVDQSYLWYMRDGRNLEHNIHLFAFITDDFYRIKSNEMRGFKKPVLRIVNGKVTTIKSFQIPRDTYFFPVFFQHMRQSNQFKFYEIFKRIIRKISPEGKGEINDNETREIALKIFETLQQINKEKDSTLVLVYLPTYAEFIQSEPMEWRKWLKTNANKKGIFYIDLYDEFLKLPFTKVTTLFNFGDEHYSEEGNRFVAEEIYKKLISYGIIKKK